MPSIHTNISKGCQRMGPGSVQWCQWQDEEQWPSNKPQRVPPQQEEELLCLEGQSPGTAAQGGPGVSLCGDMPTPAGHVLVSLSQGTLPGHGLGWVTSRHPFQPLISWDLLLRLTHTPRARPFLVSKQVLSPGVQEMRYLVYLQVFMHFAG